MLTDIQALKKPIKSTFIKDQCCLAQPLLLSRSLLLPFHLSVCIFTLCVFLKNSKKLSCRYHQIYFYFSTVNFTFTYNALTALL